MAGLHNHGVFYGPAAGGSDPATTRLRVEQTLRAVREAAKLGGMPPARVVGLSGQILEADDPGGDGARVIGTGEDRAGGR